LVNVCKVYGVGGAPPIEIAEKKGRRGGIKWEGVGWGGPTVSLGVWGGGGLIEDTSAEVRQKGGGGEVNCEIGLVWANPGLSKND